MDGGWRRRRRRGEPSRRRRAPRGRHAGVPFRRHRRRLGAADAERRRRGAARPRRLRRSRHADQGVVSADALSSWGRRRPSAAPAPSAARLAARRRVRRRPRRARVPTHAREEQQSSVTEGQLAAARRQVEAMRVEGQHSEKRATDERARLQRERHELESELKMVKKRLEEEQRRCAAERQRADKIAAREASFGQQSGDLKGEVARLNKEARAKEDEMKRLHEKHRAVTRAQEEARASVLTMWNQLEKKDAEVDTLKKENEALKREVKALREGQGGGGGGGAPQHQPAPPQQQQPPPGPRPPAPQHHPPPGYGHPGAPGGYPQQQHGPPGPRGMVYSGGPRGHPGHPGQMPPQPPGPPPRGMMNGGHQGQNGVGVMQRPGPYGHPGQHPQQQQGHMQFPPHAQPQMYDPQMVAAGWNGHQGPPGPPQGRPRPPGRPPGCRASARPGAAGRPRRRAVGDRVEVLALHVPQHVEPDPRPADQAAQGLLRDLRGRHDAVALRARRRQRAATFCGRHLRRAATGGGQWATSDIGERAAGRESGTAGAKRTTEETGAKWGLGRGRTCARRTAERGWCLGRRRAFGHFSRTRARG